MLGCRESVGKIRKRRKKIYFISIAAPCTQPIIAHNFGNQYLLYLLPKNTTSNVYSSFSFPSFLGNQTDYSIGFHQKERKIPSFS
jgi:hypothetical protein